jgi:hypothetical protein
VPSTIEDAGVLETLRPALRSVTAHEP